jgi:hypothetical protein
MRAYLIHLGLTQCDTMNINKAAVLAYVHDPRNYGYDSSFGPYMSDGSGRINWVHLRAIHRTIAMHLVDLREDEPFVLVFSLVPIVVLPERHPAWDGPRQIEEMWHCSFSFIDHHGLTCKCFYLFF